MYDFGDWCSRLSLAALFNLAGRFDQHRFWSYAEPTGFTRRLRWGVSLEFLTVVGTDALAASIEHGGQAIMIKCHNRVSRGPRTVQLRR